MANRLTIRNVTRLRAAVMQAFVVIEANSRRNLLGLGSGRNECDASEYEQAPGKIIQHNTS
jgi:hypothetical protein